jgi:hypothetical protein
MPVKRRSLKTPVLKRASRRSGADGLQPLRRILPFPILYHRYFNWMKNPTSTLPNVSLNSPVGL